MIADGCQHAELNSIQAFCLDCQRVPPLKAIGRNHYGADGSAQRAGGFVAWVATTVAVFIAIAHIARHGHIPCLNLCGWTL